MTDSCPKRMVMGPCGGVRADADSEDMPAPPAAWHDRTAAVERELQRRFGSTPQLTALLLERK